MTEWYAIDTAPTEEGALHARACPIYRACDGKHIYTVMVIGYIDEDGDFLTTEADDPGIEARDYVWWMPIPEPPAPEYKPEYKWEAKAPSEEAATRGPDEDEVAQLQGDYDEAREEIRRLKEERERLNKVVEFFRQNNDKVRAQLSEATKEILARADEGRALRQEVSDLKDEREKLYESFHDAGLRFHKYRNKLQEARRALEMFDDE